jgi:hypothetical protein
MALKICTGGEAPFPALRLTPGLNCDNRTAAKRVFAISGGDMSEGTVPQRPLCRPRGRQSI